MSLALPNSGSESLAAVAEPIPPAHTSRALRHLRWCLTRNTIRSLLSGSRLRLSMILVCCAIFWAGLFGLFWGGFEFMGMNDALFNGIFEYLFSMFFLSILVMLLFSTGIITYTALFHSREGTFLLTMPATTDRIFAYKFAEAVGLSSWGFFLLGSPLMVAYGLTMHAPPGFYLMFLAYLVSFVLIAGSIGAMVAIVVANVFPKRQRMVLGAAALATIVGIIVLGIQVWTTPGEALRGDWLSKVQDRLAFCQHPLWPSRWMSAGLIASARGE